MHHWNSNNHGQKKPCKGHKIRRGGNSQYVAGIVFWREFAKRPSSTLYSGGWEMRPREIYER